jgi:hypothetical protein
VVTVVEQNGHLALSVPNQGVFELKAPDEKGKWCFAIADQIAASFDRDKNGEVIAMKLYQSGLELELLREGVQPPVEIDLEQAKRYLGSYHSEVRGIDFRVLIQNNRLAVDVPGQLTFELDAPGDDGRRRFRAVPQVAVAFNESADGRVTSMTLYKPGQKEELPRVDGGNEDAPSTDDTESAP